MVKGNSKSAKAVIEGNSNRHASKCYKITNKNFSIGSYYYGLPHYGLLVFVFMAPAILLALVKEPTWEVK